jgi:endonuclease YncB( thermonuclease family)
MPQPPLGLTARATVERVLDGDTLDVVLQLPVRIRLLDCWAPEIHGINKPEGVASKQQLERMAPVGSHVRVQVPTSNADALGDVLTLGRVLGNVWREGDDESLSQLMVAAGMATTEKVKR